MSDVAVWMEGEHIEGASLVIPSLEIHEPGCTRRTGCLTAEEQAALHDAIESFLSEWVAHGQVAAGELALGRRALLGHCA